MRMCSIASSSRGNCVYAGDEDTHILIDVGVSKKAVEDGLKQMSLSGKDLDGILITHEHSDHVKGLGVMARAYGIPMYATAGTIQQIRQIKSLGKIDETLFHEIEPDKSFSLKTLLLKPFRVSHDSADPVAYRVESGKKAIAVATDLGEYTDYTVDNLKGLDALLLEANHDIRMLQSGSYPYYLKQRILGNRGHLCNELAGNLLDKILGSDLKRIFLGHLSLENNYPELAFESVRMEINMSESEFCADDFHISVAKRTEMSECFEF